MFASLININQGKKGQKFLAIWSNFVLKCQNFWHTHTANIILCSYSTLKMKGQINHNALWDSIFYAVFCLS